MNIIESRRGTGLIEVIISIFLLGAVGVIFAVTFMSGFKCTRQAKEYKTATAIAQRKMEQLRALSYESLTYAHLLQAGAIDVFPTSSPYTFTSRDSLSDQLPSPNSSLTVENVTDSLRKVTVTVSWQGSSSPAERSVTLTTYFADKRPRAAN